VSISLSGSLCSINRYMHMQEFHTIYARYRTLHCRLLPGKRDVLLLPYMAVSSAHEILHAYCS
jgi:hypothetical protein